jgi:hypothetical protein
VLSIVVSLISRMIFDFGFHYSKCMHVGGKVSDVPIMLVCEEAHNYVPRTGGAQYDSSRKSIERIAKEGRKYGVTLMVVSQRPSEVSETIFSQCSNFISLRLTNSVDQGYIRSLLPDLTAAVGDLLPNLGQGEFLTVGDAPPTEAQARAASFSSNPRSSAIRSPLNSPSLSVSPCMARTKNWRKSLRSSHHASNFTPWGGCTRARGRTVRVVSCPRKVGVSEGHRLAGTDRPVERGKICCRGRRQISVPIGGRADVEQLVDAAEKGGFRIGFRQSGKRCLCSFCGHRITAMACQGETPEGCVTQFGIQSRRWLGCHAGRSTLPKTDCGGKSSKPGAERAARQGQGRGATGSHGKSSMALEKAPFFAWRGAFGPVF